MKNKLFTDVYNRYHRLVIKAALDQTGDFELAQEVCQHVFWKYYDNMDTVAPDFIKAWLLITAKRAIIDNSRKASVRREVIMPTMSINTAVEYSIDELVNRTANSQLLFTIFDDLKQMNERWMVRSDLSKLCEWFDSGRGCGKTWNRSYRISSKIMQGKEIHKAEIFERI